MYKAQIFLSVVINYIIKWPFTNVSPVVFRSRVGTERDRGFFQRNRDCKQIHNNDVKSFMCNLNQVIIKIPCYLAAVILKSIL